ncbi:hypothetical protein J0S82_011916 [Galemys pyrenaicus]|uniref:Uncharacterized protein n=1 Tax=Galemys pyrenaicus TaxID=202257 RepID=A0A8J6DVR4_GALPY|nr:hypothetical protein J0S82_011916 [Galemys pyrenaicus]
MNLLRSTGTPQGPGMVSGQHIPPLRAHSGTPGPSSCGSTPSPAIGGLANSIHLKMPSGGGMASQNNMAESPIHLPALSPRRQVLTNGKPRFLVAQAGGMSGPHTLKPKQQEFGSPFPTNPGKGERGTLAKCTPPVPPYSPTVELGMFCCTIEPEAMELLLQFEK